MGWEGEEQGEKVSSSLLTCPCFCPCWALLALGSSPTWRLSSSPRILGTVESSGCCQGSGFHWIPEQPKALQQSLCSSCSQHIQNCPEDPVHPTPPPSRDGTELPALGGVWYL